MKLTKLSNLTGSGELNIENYINNSDRDITNLFLFTQGRVRLGTGSDGDKGENISGEFQLITSDAVANTEFTVSHGLGVIPIGSLVLYQDLPGHLYQGPTTGTNWTSSNVYLKCDQSSVTFLIFLLQ